MSLNPQKAYPSPGLPEDLLRKPKAIAPLPQGGEGKKLRIPVMHSLAQPPPFAPAGHFPP
ncbi:hypothetical protein GCM10008941_23560 [Rhizomicrobium palustre]